MREKTDDIVVVESKEGRTIDGEGEHGGYRNCESIEGKALKIRGI